MRTEGLKGLKGAGKAGEGAREVIGLREIAKKVHGIVKIKGPGHQGEKGATPNKVIGHRVPIVVLIGAHQEAGDRAMLHPEISGGQLNPFHEVWRIYPLEGPR